MDTIVQHFQEYMVFYIIGAVLAAPVIFLTRKYSLPALQYGLESVIYCGLMHVVVGTIVRVAAWFRTNSSMRALDSEGRPSDAVNWTTPYVEFWDRAAYDPEWVIYLEGVFALIIFILVARYRPMKVHNPHQRKYDDTGKKITAAGARGGKGGRGARPGRSYTPPDQRNYGRAGRR